MTKQEFESIYEFVKNSGFPYKLSVSKKEMSISSEFINAKLIHEIADGKTTMSCLNDWQKSIPKRFKGYTITLTHKAAGHAITLPPVVNEEVGYLNPLTGKIEFK